MVDETTLSAARFGVDIECLADVGQKLTLVSGARNVAVARRLRTPRGGLFYDPDYGYDLIQFCNADVEAAVMSEIRAGVESEALKDDRVKQASCSVTWEPSAERFRVDLRCSSAVGPFRLVLAVGSVTVETLKVEA
jgi:phage baseplate assembly protein W